MSAAGGATPGEGRILDGTAVAWNVRHEQRRAADSGVASDGSFDGTLVARFSRRSRKLVRNTYPHAEGRLAHVWLAYDVEFDGLRCRGGKKIDTAFHPNGRVKPCFPPDDVELDGVLCAASLMSPVYLHPNGRLDRCTLARAVEIDGRQFESGATLGLDSEGQPRAVSR